MKVKVIAMLLVAMKTKVYIGVLFGMMLMASCSEDTSAIDILNNELDKMSAMGVYSGTWDDGKIGYSMYMSYGESQLTVKADSMELILPELWLGNLFFIDYSEQCPDEAPFSMTVSNTVQKIAYTWQGTSSNANYVELENISNAPGYEPVYGIYSFGMTINDHPFRIDVKIGDKVTSMYDMNTKTWTIMIPIKGMKSVDLETGNLFKDYTSDSVDFPSLIVFTSTKKII